MSNLTSTPSGLLIQTKSDADEPGTFSALVTSFDNVDGHGDVGVPGMFKRTLDGWAQRGQAVPVLWDHNLREPAIGAAPIDHVREVAAMEMGDHPAGLFAKGGLFIDDSQRAREVWAGMMAGTQVSFSYGYKEVRTKRHEVNGRKCKALIDVELFEISPTFIGANRSADLLDVKSANDAAIDELEVEDEDDDDNALSGLVNRLRFL